MFTSSFKSAEAYSKVGILTDATEASPHKLIMMLFDGAAQALSTALVSMQSNDIAKKGESISWAIDIISQGLQNSLDMEKGGELAERLNALYDYLCVRLLHANAKNDIAALEEVIRLLNEIRGAWAGIESDPAVLSPNQPAP